MTGQVTPPPLVTAEVVSPGEVDRLDHLAGQRGLIIRRALLFGAIRGFFPLPVLDERIAGRVLAGLLRKLALGRQVDLPLPAVAVLTRGAGVADSLTLAAVAVVIARFAGRKFLAVLAAGRGTDEMARTFYVATLFDHYCAKLHVGGPLTVAEAARLREAIDDELDEMSLGPALTAFREGGRVLGRTLLQAPRWLVQRISGLAERFVRTGGNPDLIDAVAEPAGADDPWLERAARTVEAALGGVGSEHMASTIARFERRWQDRKAGHG
jgi:hypothetical protein